jgi:hypothetical protein
VHWIDLAQVRDRWQAVVSTVMNLAHSLLPVQVSLCITNCTERGLFSWCSATAVRYFKLLCVSSSGCKHRSVAPSDVHSEKFTPPSVVWFSSVTLSNELARDITVSY